ncbi:MAG: MCE family protein [Solirubrobacteraceae bacterium]|nr:MCE family protein [Solirubrobacteraceae bacterium]
MQKQAPTLGRLLVMVGFAFSCFGLLLFLWLAFGGPIPLKPKGYRVELTFSEANQLASEADVRISGVPVGKVKKIVNSPDGRTLVTVEMDEQYAPIPADARATLRQKTLLGETYVELSPGSPDGPSLAENATLPAKQTQATVELDEITRAFDPKTRRALQVWQQSLAEAVAGRGGDINEALGSVEPFAQDTREVLEILNSQTNAVQQLVRDTGVVFNALSEQRGELSGLITNSNQVFQVTADRNADLQATFRALPTFEAESVKTLKQLDAFSKKADPLVKQLTPVAEAAGPTFELVAEIAPDANALFTNLGPLFDLSEEGLPATQKLLGELPSFLVAFDPALKQINPLLQFVAAYRDDLRAFFANTAAASEAYDRRKGEFVHTFTASPAPINPEMLSAYPARIASNRPNAYPFPAAFLKLAQGLGFYETRQCGRPDPVLATDPGALTQLTPDPQLLLDTVKRVAFPGPGGTVPAPACKQQEKFTTSGSPTTFPQAPAAATSTEKPPAP